MTGFRCNPTTIFPGNRWSSGNVLPLVCRALRLYGIPHWCFSYTFDCLTVGGLLPFSLPHSHLSFMPVQHVIFPLSNPAMRSLCHQVSHYFSLSSPCVYFCFSLLVEIRFPLSLPLSLSILSMTESLSLSNSAQLSSVCSLSCCLSMPV